MRTIIKSKERTNAEKRTHLENGVFSVRIISDKRTMEIENNQVFDCVYENGKLVSETDVTDYYNVDGTEKF